MKVKLGQVAHVHSTFLSCDSDAAIDFKQQPIHQENLAKFCPIFPFSGNCIKPGDNTFICLTPSPHLKPLRQGDNTGKTRY